MLHAHMKLVPEDFFDVELSKDNFLVPCLSALLQVRRCRESSRNLETRVFGWHVSALVGFTQSLQFLLGVPLAQATNP